MGLFIIALIVVIAIEIKERDDISSFIAGLFGMFTITLILTGILNICLEPVAQTPYLVTDTKIPLHSFEENYFLVNFDRHINYLINTKAGLEIKNESIENTVIYFTEGEPCVYVQRYRFSNPILNFMVFNMHYKRAFYIPEDTELTKYYIDVKGG